MCGIIGITEENEKLVEQMRDKIQHRGIDDKGMWSDDNVTLGQVRLSIIDLSSAGHQPMSNADKTLWIVFNGEIYNHMELRKTLKKNHNFQTTCDTATILAMYEEYGIECFKKFNGFWAIAIYDVIQKRIILSRDRLGKKPLYYSLVNGKLSFASELKALMLSNKKINIEALDLYFSLGFIPSPMTIFCGASKVEGGQNIIFDLKTNLITKSFYYQIPETQIIGNNIQLIKEADKIMKDSVKMRMVADVPVGAYLSGGLDSSYVVSQMAKFTDLKNLNTFSIGFEGKYDETKYMEIVRKHLGTKHHHYYFKKEDFEELLDKISFHYDEPYSDFSNFPSYFISEKAKEKVSVVLTGDGGDEIFGGYPMHQVALQMSILKKLPKILRKIIHSILPKKDNLTFLGKLKEGLRESFYPDEDYYAELGANLVYKPEAYKKWSREKMQECLLKSKGNLVEAVIKFDQFYGTLGDNFLTKVDRASMAHSLEARSPFLDYRLIELSNKIPTNQKVSLFNTKILMRKILKNHLPKEIVNRGKQGFTPPLMEWMKEEKYKNMFMEALDEMEDSDLLSEEWQKWFTDAIGREDYVAMHYKIRLLLLWKWYQYWMVDNGTQ